MLYITRNKKIGIALILGASICYGLMPSIVKFSYKAGLSSETQLVGRYFFALLVTWAYIFLSKFNYKIPKATIVTAILAGAFLAGAPALLNESYKYLPGAVVSVIGFSYVAMVLVGEVMIKREKINLIKTICVMVSLVGVVIILWDPSGSLSLKGMILALLSGVSYAIYALILGKKNVLPVNPSVIIGYALMPVFIINVVRCLITGHDLLPSSGVQLLYILLLAIFCSSLSNIFYCKAIQLIGSSNTAIINTFEVLVAYTAGVIFFSDVVTPRAIVGGLLIIATIIILNAEKQVQHEVAPEKP